MQRYVYVYVIFLFVVLARAQEPRGETPHTAKGAIHGTIMAPDESRLPFASFAIEDLRGHRITVSANSNGDYTALLPTGSYHIVENRIGGLSLFRRSRFAVQPGNERLINIVPTPPQPIVESICPTPGDCGEAMATDLGFHYDYFAPSAGTLFAHDVLIQFKTKRVLTKNEIEYSGPFTMASYDNLAVYADHIHINTERLELWADGNIVYEDGAARRRAEHVHIDINARKLVAEHDGKLIEIGF